MCAHVSRHGVRHQYACSAQRIDFISQVMPGHDMAAGMPAEYTEKLASYSMAAGSRLYFFRRTKICPPSFLRYGILLHAAG